MPKKIRRDPVIPDHEVLRKIGGGAYGEVWLARGVTGAMRAVKVVRRADFEDVRTFEREFQGILSYEPLSRDHPGLVKVLHVGRSEDDKFYYYVMELGDDVENGAEINPADYVARNLRTDMKAAGGHPLETDFCLEIGQSLAEALSHLHDCDLAHRDVKPSNVIFVDGRAKLADIGLVAAKDQRTFVGTEGFVPPEGPGSAQADVYSLGKVLYEMATGRDRLDFPELPEEGVPEHNRKKWLALNRLICDVCEPHVSRRKITTAKSFSENLGRLLEGKSPLRRVSVPSAVTMIVCLCAIFFVWQWWALAQWGTETIESDSLPTGPFFRAVKVITNLEGVDVRDEEGTYLGVTPLTISQVEAGKNLVLNFEMKGYRDKQVSERVEMKIGSPFEMIVEMDPFTPPIENDVWVDALDMTYLPRGGSHRSARMVSVQDWRRYQDETKSRERPDVLQLSQEGQRRKVVVVSEDDAWEYAEWLTALCMENGQLPTAEDKENPLMEIRPKMNRMLTEAFLSPEFGERGLWPFFLEVRAIPFARLIVESEPPDARLFVNGEFIGNTPQELEVPPGSVSYRLEKEGYQSLAEQSLELGDRERKKITLTLEKSEGVIFGEEWVNSLGMKFVPLGEDLMVAVWETRLRDYRAYEKKVGAKNPRPKFKQNLDHPVVFVSRDDALAFCRWLTEQERGTRLQDNHIYRLPTDAEWSEMVGLAEEGDFPAMKEFDLRFDGLYPWGLTWPPQDKVGNYAGQEALIGVGVGPGKVIPEYLDPYEKTAPVGSFPPNEMGLYDLGGNVQEWVMDQYQPESSLGVTRGGSWNSHQKENIQSRYRNALSPSRRLDLYGFRVVLAKEPSTRQKNENTSEQ